MHGLTANSVKLKTVVPNAKGAPNNQDCATLFCLHGIFLLRTSG